MKSVTYETEQRFEKQGTLELLKKLQVWKRVPIGSWFTGWSKIGSLGLAMWLLVIISYFPCFLCVCHVKKNEIFSIYFVCIKTRDTSNGKEKRKNISGAYCQYQTYFNDIYKAHTVRHALAILRPPE